MKERRSSLDIVESPSVGFVRVTPTIGELVETALLVMLLSSEHRYSTRVYVRCGIDHPKRVLQLKVIDDGRAHAKLDRVCIELIRNKAEELGLDPDTLGLEFSQEKEGAVVTLTIPVLSV